MFAWLSRWLEGTESHGENDFELKLLVRVGVKFIYHLLIVL